MGEDLIVKIIPTEVSPMKSTIELIKETSLQRINEPQKIKISLFDDYNNKCFDSQSLTVSLMEGKKEKTFFVPENEYSFLCRFTPLTSESQLLLKHKNWKKPISTSFYFSEERKFRIFFKKENSLKISNFILKLLEFSSLLPSQVIKTKKIEDCEIIFVYSTSSQFTNEFVISSKKYQKLFFLLYAKENEKDFEKQNIYDHPTFFFLIDNDFTIKNNEENRKEMIQLMNSLNKVSEN